MTLPQSAQLPAIAIRRIAPEDKDALVAGLGRLSQRSVYQRFLSPKPRLTASELRYLTEVDFIDHVALVAVLARSPEVVVGVGRWVRDAQRPAEAEVAIVIADDLQDRGVGSRLGRELVVMAAQRGIATFTASMLPSNRAAHRLLAKLSAQLVAIRRRGADELAVPRAAA